VSDSATTSPKSEAGNENEFSCSFHLKSIYNKPASVNDCTVKEQDVSLLMSLKSILVVENELVEAAKG